MKYWGPINSPGGINGNDPYVDGNPGAGIEGSIPTFHGFEQPLRGLQRLVQRSGFTPDPATDDYQIAQAVRSQGLNYFQDTGTADAMVVSTSLNPPLIAYSGGLPLHIKKVNSTNTTNAPTVQVDGLAAKVVVNADGSTLAPGMLPALGLIVVMYDPGLDKFRLQNGVGNNQAALQNAAFPQKQIYNIAGVYTWVVPVGVTKCRAHVWGAGGGGGGALGSAAGGSGGGGGGYAEEVCLVTPGAPITVTVGAGGAGAATGSNGDGITGGTSSFGSFCSATGGLRGVHAGSNLAPGGPAGTGGSGAGGDLNLSGTYGGSGAGDTTSDAEKYGGYGGQAPLGGGGGYQSTGTSGPGMWPGGGGSGGGGNAATSSPGGPGAAGGVIIEFVTPS